MVQAGVLIGLVGGLLAFCPWAADPFVAPKFFVLSFGALLAIVGHARRAGGQRTLLDLPLTILLAVTLLTVWHSTDVVLSVVGLRAAQFYALLPLVVAVAFYYATAWGGMDRDRVLSWVCAAGAGCALYGLTQAGQKVDWLTGLPSFSGRAGGTFGSPVYMGCVLAMLLPVNTYLLQNGRERWSASCVLTGLGLLATGSRGSVLAGFGAVALYLLLSRRWTLGRTHVARIACIVAIVTAISCGVLLALGRVSTKASDSGRVETWRAAVEQFQSAPILGTGPETFSQHFRFRQSAAFVRAMRSNMTSQASAHNDILQVAATMGVAGLLAYGLVLLMVFTMLVYGVKTNREVGAVVTASLAACFVHAKVNPVPLYGMALVGALVGFLPFPHIATPKWRNRLTAGMLGLLLAASLLASAATLAGEVFYFRALVRGAAGDILGSAMQYTNACRVAPWEQEFRTRQVESLMALSSLAGPGERAAIAGVAVQQARVGVAWHQQSADAHELLGASTALYAYERTGGFAEAMDALDYAQRLAPTYTPIAMKRMSVGQMAKDPAYRARAEADLKRMEALR